MLGSILEETIASHETPGTPFYPPFAVTPELEAEADDRISHYPASKRSATLPLLHIVQHKFGYISAAAIEWVAAKLDLEPIKVVEVVTFYPGFRQSAPGKFHIRVCRTLSCAMGGSYELMEKLCELTGIDREAGSLEDRLGPVGKGYLLRTQHQPAPTMDVSYRPVVFAPGGMRPATFRLSDTRFEASRSMATDVG